MFDLIKKWFGAEDEDEDELPARASALNRTSVFRKPDDTEAPPPEPLPPRPAVQTVRIRPVGDDEIVDAGPGKNVLVRSDDSDEDTQELLALVDEGEPAPEPQGGIDPYNTGKFDRSKNWDKRFR